MKLLRLRLRLAWVLLCTYALRLFWRAYLVLTYTMLIPVYLWLRGFYLITRRSWTLTVFGQPDDGPLQPLPAAPAGLLPVVLWLHGFYLLTRQPWTLRINNEPDDSGGHLTFAPGAA